MASCTCHSSCIAARLQFANLVWFKRCSFCLHQCRQVAFAVWVVYSATLLSSPTITCELCVQVRARGSSCCSQKPRGPENG